MQLSRPASTLSALLDSQTLQWLAGDDCLGRARSFVDGVVFYKESDVAVAGHVAQTYTAGISLVENDIEFQCTCPENQEDIFCAHLAALALSWLDMRANGLAIQESGTDGKDTDAVCEVDVLPDTSHLYRTLMKQPRGILVDFLVEYSAKDRSLYDRLAALGQAGEASPNESCSAVTSQQSRSSLHCNITSTPEAEVPSRPAVGGATSVAGANLKLLQQECNHPELVLASMNPWLEKPDALQAPDQMASLSKTLESIVSECADAHSLQCLEHTLDEVIMSLSSLIDEPTKDTPLINLMRDLEHIHLGKCRLSPPEKEHLANYLFASHVNYEWVFKDALKRGYASVLGPSGIEHYQKRLEHHWWETICRSRGKIWRAWYDKPEQLRLLALLESATAYSKDAEFLVTLYARNLSWSQHYNDVAELYLRLGDQERAVEWARRGIIELKGRHCYQLKRLLAHCYADRAEIAEALSLLYENFVELHHLNSYRELKEFCQSHAPEDWHTYRQRCLGYLEGLYRGTIEPHNPFADPLEALRQLIAILIAEQDYPSAWRFILAAHDSVELKDAFTVAPYPDATREDYSRRILQQQLLQISTDSWESHPEQAYHALQRAAEAKIAEKKADTYVQACDYLSTMEEIAIATNKLENFRAYIAHLRSAHQSKVSLMTLFDERGWRAEQGARLRPIGKYAGNMSPQRKV